MEQVGDCTDLAQEASAPDAVLNLAQEVLQALHATSELLGALSERGRRRFGRIPRTLGGFAHVVEGALALDPFGQTLDPDRHLVHPLDGLAHESVSLCRRGTARVLVEWWIVDHRVEGVEEFEVAPAVENLEQSCVCLSVSCAQFCFEGSEDGAHAQISG